MKNALGKKENLNLYNDNGVLVYEFYTHSKGFWYKRTFDDKGDELTFKNSDGDWSKFTYDDNGNQLTYEDSDGVSRCFDIPEYTMEELTAKLGNFKIKKQ